MAAGVLGEAEGDGESEHAARSRPPHQHGKRRSGDEEQCHAGGEGGHDEGDQPAMPPWLDEKGFGDPIEPEQKIAEAEPEPGQARAFQSRAEAGMIAVAAVEQPDQRSEGQEQRWPEMQRGEGQH